MAVGDGRGWWMRKKDLQGCGGIRVCKWGGALVREWAVVDRRGCGVLVRGVGAVG